MSLTLCLKAKICKKGKLVKKMEEGSWGRPSSAPNRAKMAKYKFFIKNQEKRQKLPWHSLRIYIIKIVNELALPYTWRRGLRGRSWGSPNCAKTKKKTKNSFFHAKNVKTGWELIGNNIETNIKMCKDNMLP